ncbi:MAG: hypothetical protein H7Y19_10325 [Luteimonas sp.]|nr:hypothetical protein [Luteimonas sp.]
MPINFLAAGESMRIQLLSICLLSLPAAAATTHFTNFPVTAIYKGAPAAVDFSSLPELKQFRTVLKNGAAKGPNFAGNLTIVSWGCGTSCLAVAILSAESGKILSRLNTCGGVEYKLDSALLIANPPDPDTIYPAGCKTEFYQWTDRQLKKIEP